MHEVTPPQRQYSVRNSDGAIVYKGDTGGQDNPSPVTIPDDCEIVGESDADPVETDALSDLTIDKAASPWYAEQADGSYSFVGLR